MRPRRPTWLTVTCLAVLLLAVLPSAGASARMGAPTFQATSAALYLTGDEGPHGLVLAPAPGSEGTTTFLLPGIAVLGLLDQPANETWSSAAPWPKHMEVTQDSDVTLTFSANVQALAIFRVRLLDIDATGGARVVAQDERQFVTALDPSPETFHLETAGAVLPAGDTVRLEVQAETLQAAVVMSYGGDGPPAIQAISTRFLDSDGDGYADSDEELSGTNPFDPLDHDTARIDTDEDGLSDRFEAAVGTDPQKADTDGDGYGDGIEVHAGSDPRDPASKPYDSDGDGLPDVFENTYFTNSTTVNNGAGGGPGAGGAGTGLHDDPDGDGCDNLCELLHGTDPTDPDTDGDGVSDGNEVQAGTSPTSATIGGLHGVPEPIAAAAMFAVGTTLSLLALLRRP